MTHSNECSIWESQPAGDDGWHDCTCHVFCSNESSIHDSLCPTWHGCVVCECDTIAKVRADCLEKVEGAYVVGSDGKALTPSHPEYSHDGTETWNSAIDLAVAYMTGKID